MVTMTRKKPKPEKIAVIDIGSNSVRLVIYDTVGTKPIMIEQTKATCRLAQGMLQDKPRLSLQGRVKTLKALKRFRIILGDHGVTDVVALATAAMRAVAKTHGGETFTRQAEKALGHKIRIISGREEARLMARGLMAAMPGIAGICADLGGGSMELASVGAGHIHHTATLNLGSLVLYSEAKGNTLTAAYRAREQIGKVSFLRQAHGQTLYVIGGSWRAVGRLMKLAMGKPIKHVHGFAVGASLAREKALTLAAQNPAAFSKKPKKISQRARVLPLAAAVMVELIDAIKPARVIFSGHGLREGALIERLKKVG